MAALATVPDVEARWRPLTDQERLAAQAMLDDASSIVRRRVGDVDARLVDPDYARLVAAVVVAMVLRVLRNPDGKRSETIDDYSYTRDQATASGALYLEDDAAALLAVSSSEAFTVRPSYVAP